MTSTHRGVTDPIGADLLRLLKTLKLGAMADTLPERAALARQHKLSHIGFLETLLADEVSRANPAQQHYEQPKPASTPTCGSTPGPHTPTYATTAPSWAI